MVKGSGKLQISARDWEIARAGGYWAGAQTAIE
jgi:hypothetical protein